jgi:hypothetical protein
LTVTFWVPSKLPAVMVRSVRNKLIQAGFRNRNEEDKEYNEMYSVPDREEHRMFN